MSKWIVRQTDADLKLMSKILNINETIARILANRNIRTKNTAIRYLYPKTDFFFDTRRMKDVVEAFEIIKASIKNNERIVVYGDYDVDGVTGTVILTKALKQLGADVLYYIPHRESEGYGLNVDAVKKIKSFETDLVITCDNGIASLEEIKAIKDNNMKAIIIDHHEPDFLEQNDFRTDVIPKADAVIDPKQRECEYPFKMMCAAGVAYKFCKELYKTLGAEFDKDSELLIFAMIGTFCDIVDLVEENRIIAKKGLEYINQGKIKNIGLKALLKEKNLIGKIINSFDIGFLIGPCINATGRLEHASLAVELFLTDDEEVAAGTAKKLSELNEERKRLTNDAVKNSLSLLNENPQDLTKVLVIYDKEIHESVAGIVAGRIKDTFFRPTIVLTKGENCVKGSARSIECYNIFENLNNNRELFLRFGGHQMAAGLSIEEDKIDILKKRLNEACLLTEDDFTEIIYIDKELDSEDITLDLAYEIKKLEPFGKGNKEPVFLSRNMIVNDLRLIEDKNTIILTLGDAQSYKKLRAVCFGKIDDFKCNLKSLYDDYTYGKIKTGNLKDVLIKIDVVYNIAINEYNNNISVNLKLKDFKIHN